MTAYKAPLRDMRFLLNEVIGLEKHYQQLGLQDLNQELIDAILEEGAKFASNELAPLNREGDEQGVVFNAGEVTTPAGFKHAYRQYCDNGWASMTAPAEFGGQDLPNSLATPFHEMTMSANLSWRTYPGLTEGATLAIYAHGSEQLKHTYLEKMISGEWSGTMCLTEPQAGTDLALLRTKAEPNADGSYAITGTKIFITAGEHDLSDNIVHLVLAKLPDAPSGSKGISLFAVPKFLADDQGQPGERNSLSCGSVEHKMGIKASATCVMNFEAAKGWLVGGEHQGLACMFTMMNDARFQVGLQGLGIAEMAFQGALEYANDRLQTRSLSGVKNPDQAADPIIVHPDVRRMLLTQKALTEGSRLLAYEVATLLDKERFAKDASDHKQQLKLLALLVPIVKSFLTDISQECASLGVQVYGGHGFIREWGMEQLMRDSRILMLYEGTNGIQALDYLRRKVIGDQAETLARLQQQFEQDCSQAQQLKDEVADGHILAALAGELNNQLNEWQQLSAKVQIMSAANPEEVGACSVDFLQYSAYVSLAGYWLRMANKAAQQMLLNPDDSDFYQSKISTAQFYFDRILPRCQMHKASLLSGADNLMSLAAEHFAF
ncbi:acyl-CoA dehydrogenase C-terminal domain-containing protein [Bacterioplanoides sp.]|uniref:acyl-CoA dehydrogenase C-terminal domain-containing protein n=1 Tax=Bacterioplanoides sp. TaxID=2066072 RepID=UPI003B5B21FE